MPHTRIILLSIMIHTAVVLPRRTRSVA